VAHAAAALALGATRWQSFPKGVLPPSLPEILTGIRIALGLLEDVPVPWKGKS
jgi:ABC-type nitrate/sulfonate/bicarbonate transport system permease component